MTNEAAPPTGVSSDALAPENRTLGRYELRYRVARGGMATVYLARLSTEQGFAKWLAIKTIHPHVADDAKYVELFLDEARLAARINHPNVCSVFDFGASDGTYFLAMEYLHGQALNQVMRRLEPRQGLPAAIAARIVADIAQGLHAAHELRDAQGQSAGVVHRDVSPHNVFVLYDGIAKVVDFGIAKSNQSQRARTSTRELKGKLAYMSPEQLHREEVDRRGDLWALGVVLWEVLAGRHLFARESEIATVDAIARDPIPVLSSVRPDVPPALEAVVSRALQRDASARYQTAEDFARDLERFLASLPSLVSHAEVGRFMRTLFERDIADRDAILREGEQPAVASLPPPVETEPPGTFPSLPPPAHSVETLAAFSLDVPARAPLPIVHSQVRPEGNSWRTSRLWLVAIGTVTVISVAYLWRPEHIEYLRRMGRGLTESSPEPDVHIPGAVQRPDAFATPVDAAMPSDVAVHAPGTPANAPVGVGVQPLWHMPATTGRLSLETTSETRVVENGRQVGITPIRELPMRPGVHVLQLVSLDGRRRRTLTVTIRAGQTVVQRVP